MNYIYLMCRELHADNWQIVWDIARATGRDTTCNWVAELHLHALLRIFPITMKYHNFGSQCIIEMESVVFGWFRLPHGSSLVMCPICCAHVLFRCFHNLCLLLHCMSTTLVDISVWYL